MNRIGALLLLVALLPAGCHKGGGKQEKDSKGDVWPRVLATPNFVRAGMPGAQTVENLTPKNHVPGEDLDAELVIRPIKERLEGVARRQKHDGTFTGAIYILLDRECTMWLSRQLVETAAAAGYDKPDVFVNEASPTSI